MEIYAVGQPDIKTIVYCKITTMCMSFITNEIAEPQNSGMT